MLVDEGLTRLEFDNQYLIDEQISEVIPDHRAVFVVDFQGELLLHVDSSLAETVRQGVLVHLFQVAVFQLAMNGVTGLSHNVTETVHVVVIHGFAFFLFLCLFVAIQFASSRAMTAIERNRTSVPAPMPTRTGGKIEIPFP